MNSETDWRKVLRHFPKSGKKAFGQAIRRQLAEAAKITFDKD